MNKPVKQALIWIAVIASLVLVNVYLDRTAHKRLNVSYSDMLAKVEAGEVKDVSIDQTTLTGHLADNQSFRATIPAHDPEMYDTLRNHGVNVIVTDHHTSWVSVLVSILPFGLLLTVWFVILRFLQRKAGLTRTEPPLRD